MRFVLAFSALVLSGIMLVLGIGQVTFLAGPHKVTYSTNFDAPNGLAVFSADQFDTLTGQANVVVEGDEPFAATGHVRDIEAWTAAFPHAEITANAKAKSLESTKIPANSEAAAEFAALSEATDQEKIELPSPFGSDLWLDQRGSESEHSESKTQTVRMPVSLEEDQAVLVAVAESSKSPKLSIEWVQDRRTPWAGPLLVGGGVFALLGAILYLLAVDHDRRGLGPRRGRKGPLQGIRNSFTSSKSKSGDDSAKPNKTKAKKNTAPTANDPSDETAVSEGNPAADTSTENNSVPGNADQGEASTEEGTLKRVVAPKKGKTMKRAIVIPAIAVTAALGLSGCTANYWPDFSADEEVADAPVEADAKSMRAPVPVSQTQIARILGDISALSGEADDSLDAGPLAARFTGAALIEREANYTIRKAVPDYEVVVPRITDKELGYQIVQSTESWPRTVFVVVASESAPETAEETATEGAAADDKAAGKDSPSLALVMTQENPYENFLVSRTIALRGGITMPEAAPAEEGAALLANDLSTLALTPTQVGVDYSAVLAGGPAVAQAEKFNLEGDSLIERSGAAWAAQSTEKAAANGEQINYSVSVAQQDESTLGLSTGTGGALVASTVLETRVEAPPEGTRWRPTVPKSLTALSGLEGQQDKLVSVVAHQLLFFVPSASSGEKIQLLGYTSDLVSASNS